jgi:hypothetical protein
MASPLFRAAVGALATMALGGAAWVDPRPSPPVAVQQVPLEVSDWALAGGRLTMTLHGNAAALDQLRSQGRLVIQVHWQRAGAQGAPDLVTELPVAGPGLVPALAGEVQRQGYFAWHSWAQKDTLSPGPWTVSLTGPDGQPVPCAPQQGPCRFSFTAG